MQRARAQSRADRITAQVRRSGIPPPRCQPTGLRHVPASYPPRIMKQAQARPFEGAQSPLGRADVPSIRFVNGDAGCGIGLQRQQPRPWGEACDVQQHPQKPVELSQAIAHVAGADHRLWPLHHGIGPGRKSRDMARALSQRRMGKRDRRFRNGGMSGRYACGDSRRSARHDRLALGPLGAAGHRIPACGGALGLKTDIVQRRCIGDTTLDHRLTAAEGGIVRHGSTPDEKRDADAAPIGRPRIDVRRRGLVDAVQVDRGHLAAAILFQIIADALILGERRKAGALDRRDVDERIRAAALRRDEAIPLVGVEEFDGGTRVAAPDAGLQGKREKGSQSADKPSICDYSERDMGVGCPFCKGGRDEGHVCLSIGDRHVGLRRLLRRSGRLLGSERAIRCSGQGRGMFGKATASPGLSQAVRIGVRTPVARPQARRVPTLNKRGS
ncbi:hypothetical protein WR25_23456 [Diploscapter pachys]|uniref:Uncharacterized protein n=1 Tax=Diploscapter pachys TaxID=2018661 RepID=A0A2A2KIL2_9BILA|nr:hypothetical protein WR25_23456 [Diploscapter pachys]